MTELEERLRDARRALEAADPPTDLWERALDRASGGGGSASARHVADRRWRRSSLLAVAAAVAAVALVSALAIRPDDQAVHTGRADDDRRVAPGPTTTRPVPAPATVVAGDGCPFGIAGEPLVMERGPVDPSGPRFDAEPGQSIAHTVIGSQVAEVRVPGFTLHQPGGWRIEDIELARGPARLWLDGPPSGEEGRPFVQVRWSSASDEPCGSFTVTVDGGTEEENRAVAVDLAERILLPEELGDPDLPGAEGGPVAGLELPGTEWRVVASSSGPMGSDAIVSFGDTTVRWSEGCATAAADYHLDREHGFLLLSNHSSTNPGCTPPSVFDSPREGWTTIRALLGADRVAVVAVLEFPGGSGDEVARLLRLGDLDGDHIVLAPA